MKIFANALLSVGLAIGLTLDGDLLMPDFNINSAAIAANSGDWKNGLKAYLEAEQVKSELAKYANGLNQFAKAQDPAARLEASKTLDQVNLSTAAKIKSLSLMSAHSGHYGERIAAIATSAQSQFSWYQEMRHNLAAPAGGARFMYKNPHEDDLRQLLATMRKTLTADESSAAAPGPLESLKNVVAFKIGLADLTDNLETSYRSVVMASETDRKRIIGESTASLNSNLHNLEKQAATLNSMQVVVADSLNAFKAYWATSRKVFEVYETESRPDVAQYAVRKLSSELQNTRRASEQARELLTQSISREL